MAKPKIDKFKASRYDKILRANTQASLPAFIWHVLGINIADREAMPDGLLDKKERKPDFFEKVTDSTGKTYLLHIDFMVKGNTDEMFKMVENSITRQKKHRLPVYQYIVYLGMGHTRMPASVEHKDFRYSYQLVQLSLIDYRLFLQSEFIEIKLWAILGSFGKEDSAQALDAILENILKKADADPTGHYFLDQLRVLAQLRGLETPFNKAMEKISKYFSKEKDALYREGRETGRQELLERLVANMMTRLGLSDEQIVAVSGASITWIKQVRADLPLATVKPYAEQAKNN